MQKLTTLVLMMLTLGVLAQAPLPQGVPGPNLPKGKAPEQGFVPDGWPPHAGALLKYSVADTLRRGTRDDARGHEVRPSVGRHDRRSEQRLRVQTRRADRSAGRLRFPGQVPALVGEGHVRDGRMASASIAIRTSGRSTMRDIRFSSSRATASCSRRGAVKGVSGSDAKTFNRPTDLAWDSQGNPYVSDGYGNTRVVKFDKAGNYVTAWGTPGDGPGQFRVPHSIGVDSKDRVYVSDRENNRIQIFDGSGKLLKIWTHLGCTQGMFITPKDEMWILTHRNNSENITYDTLAGQLMKIDLESGKILGAMESPGHMLTVAQTGDIYVASLTGNVFKWQPNPWWPARAHEAQRSRRATATGQVTPATAERFGCHADARPAAIWRQAGADLHVEGC